MKEKKIVHAFAVLYYKALSLIPKTKKGDRAYAVISFFIFHNRLPSKKLLFNDVLHQLKINGELGSPLRVFTSDKEFVKQYIASVVGEKYVVPTIAVLKSVADVDDYKFPANCCIKPTHASGKFIFRKNNEPIKLKEVKSWFSLNYYFYYRELNYKDLAPKVIVEPLLFNTSSIRDYRIFCYKGKAKMIMLDIARNVPGSRKLYDVEWNEFKCDTSKSRALDKVEKPKNLCEMLSIAEKLSAQFTFVRIDLYTNGDVCKVGEITHCHSRALELFTPKGYESEISKCIFSADREIERSAQI